VKLLANTIITAVFGEDHLEAITLTDVKSGRPRKVPADAVFIFIGTAPRTEMLADFVLRDAEGFILTGRDTIIGGKLPPGWTTDREPFPFETSVPGIFAAGDVRHGSGKRVAAAVGEGSATIGMVHRYLQTV
jgi:thioredoxin reductase (NADPH)